MQFIVGPENQVSGAQIPLQNGSPAGGPAISMAADLSGTGRADIVVAFGVPPAQGSQKLPLLILRAGPDGVLADVTTQLLGSSPPGTEAPRQMVLGDFNRDGRLNFFIGDHGFDAPPYPGRANVLVLSNANGTLTDKPALLPSAPDFTHSAAVGDIDGDGLPDIFVGNLPAPVQPYFLTGRPDETFALVTNRIAPDITFANGNTYTASLLVDVNGDGFADLVLGPGQGNVKAQSIILYNDGLGGFKSKAPYVLPGAFANTVAVLDITALDVNGDGFPDLIIVGADYSQGTYQGTYLRMLINRGDGTFADETASRMGASAAGLNPAGLLKSVVADLNGDGYADFYITGNIQAATFGAGSVNMMWINNKSGTFTPVSSTALGPGLNFPVAVDIDADGMLDFVTVNVHNVSGKISYRTFLNRTARSVPSEPRIGTAVAGNARASIFFNAPFAAGPSPVTGYIATCNPGKISGAGAASPIIVTGLANDKLYACTVTATSAAGSSVASNAAAVRPAASAAQTAALALSFAVGWNLAGNGAATPLDAAAAFGDTSKVSTVWKWNATSAKWAFYAPSPVGSALTDYAASKGYEVLTSIAGGEGVWVNARAAFTAQLPAGAAIQSAAFQAMAPGWNLIAVGDGKTFSQFNSLAGAAAPLATLWAWDAALANWYFYAPSLQAKGGTALADYIAGKSYLDFGSRTLGNGTGFWVNR